MAYIKINKQNFFHNLNEIALKTGSVDKVGIVLKDNAYGHGLKLMAKLASEFGVKHAIVRKTDEAFMIKELFETILVLGDNSIKDEKISFTINTLSDIKNAEKDAKVELKVDTGMHRNGIAMDEVDLALELLSKYHLELVGVMTHYRSADELSSELFWQKKQFETVKEKIKQAGFTKVRVHSYNSASILRSKHFSEDLVRVGIGAYGYNELPRPFDKVVLRPVLSLYANKVSTLSLKKGQRVGYGGDFAAPKDMMVSTYDLGYGDGWCRGDSKNAYITAEGLSVLGRVSMDFIVLASQKEEICVMNDAQYAAKQLDTISYEITTALNPHISKRLDKN